jgi:PHP family Zn ribbon phosphoesterase
MHPSAIVEEAVNKGVDVIAICDHNSSENVGYVMKAALGMPLTVIPGMEVTTKEEVHVVALLESTDALSRLQEHVYERLDGLNNEDVFGLQPIVTEEGEVEGFNERLLIGAAKISLEELVELIHRLGGIAISAHIDRPGFGVIGQLGFVPPNVPFDALEISWRLGVRGGREKYPELKSYPFVTSSDAHFIDDIGKACTPMLLEAPTLSEIRMALRGEEGRSILEDQC